MRILVVTARYYPEQFSIVPICERFVDMGHSVSVITGKPNYGYWKVLEGYEKIDRETINGVCVFRVNETPRKKGLLGLIINYISIFNQYKKFLSKHKGTYDIVISHVMSPIFTMHGIKRFCNKNKIPHVHYGLDLWPESLIASSYMKRNNIIFQAIKIYSRKIYRACDYITFASPSAEQYFRNYLNIRDIPFKHVYQPTLTTTPKLSVVKEHEYIINNTVHLLYCGSIARFHRLDIFLDGLKLFIDTCKCNIRFDVVGSGSELDDLIMRSKLLNLEQYVHFHGRVPIEKTKAFFANADILYVPLEDNSATSKMIPQKLIEYLMYNRPIIGMINGDGLDILKAASKYNVTCCQNKEDIFKALTIMERQLSIFEIWGDDNRKFYDSNPRFSLDVICKELEDVCGSVLFKK